MADLSELIENGIKVAGLATANFRICWIGLEKTKSRYFSKVSFKNINGLMFYRRLRLLWVFI